jgi:hypothetical protein
MLTDQAGSSVADVRARSPRDFAHTPARTRIDQLLAHGVP